MYIELAILALFIFIYSMVAGRIERSAISGPMVFVIAGFLMGPFGFGWLKGDATSDDLRTMAEVPNGEFLALVVICTVLFSLVAHGITAHPLARWLARQEASK